MKKRVFTFLAFIALSLLVVPVLGDQEVKGPAFPYWWQEEAGEAAGDREKADKIKLVRMLLKASDAKAEPKKGAQKNKRP